MPWSKQSTIEDLWAVFTDYLDRVHARLDVAFNDAAVYIACTAEVGHSIIIISMGWDIGQHHLAWRTQLFVRTFPVLQLEREVRLWKARYEELLHVKQQLEMLQQQDAAKGPEVKADLAMEEANSEEVPVSVPQPAEDR
jgi:hypothetical protein